MKEIQKKISLKFTAKTEPEQLRFHYIYLLSLYQTRSSEHSIASYADSCAEQDSFCI